MEVGTIITRYDGSEIYDILHFQRLWRHQQQENMSNVLHLTSSANEHENICEWWFRK